MPQQDSSSSGKKVQERFEKTASKLKCFMSNEVEGAYL
jgi:hypothetical protein